MTNFKTGGPWVTRFAPSPTGVLHLGNARTAILNGLLARQSGGTFLLRLEDTDQERSSFASEAAILWSLAWLGLIPDQPARHQSLRLSYYHQAVAQLHTAGKAYPCFCSEAELAQERRKAAEANLPPRYSGRCAALSAEIGARRMQTGEAHVMRFRAPLNREVHFQDLIKGSMTVPASAFGDFVLLRSSGWPSYNLAVVVDDVDMGVTLVLRGEDHLTNTARQILLYEALGHSSPRFAHHGLLVDRDGKKLSKRTGALGIPECMQRGLEPLAVVHYLASLSGALSTKKIYASLDDMAQDFNPFALGRGNAVMSVEELYQLSVRYFRAAAAQEHCDRLDQLLPIEDSWHKLNSALHLELVMSLRENASNLDALRDLLPFFTQPDIAYSPAALEELRSGRAVLECMDAALVQDDTAQRLTSDEATQLLRQVSSTANVKGRALYHPLRLALTGTAAGPELTALLTLLPVSWIRQRLHAPLAILFSKQKD